MKLLKEESAGWSAIMNETKNPLKSYSLPVAHMMMQMLAWMWSAIFSISLGSFFVFGISSVAHVTIIAGVFITMMAFENADANR